MFETKNTKSVRTGLSKGETYLLTSLAEEDENIFALKDVITKLDCTYANAKVIVNRLVKKKWIVQLKRGTYLIVPLNAGPRAQYTEHEFVIASYLVKPYYIAYWSALNYHALTEQIPLTVFIATTKRSKERRILDANYRFVTLNQRKFFGLRKITISKHSINISDKEKTIIDCLDHPEYCGGIIEAAKALWNASREVSYEKLLRYAMKIGNQSVLKRLGFLLESLEITIPEETIAAIHERMSKGFSALDPTESKKGTYNTRWNLLVNVPKNKLLEWRETY